MFHTWNHNSIEISQLQADSMEKTTAYVGMNSKKQLISQSLWFYVFQWTRLPSKQSKQSIFNTHVFFFVRKFLFWTIGEIICTLLCFVFFKFSFHILSMKPFASACIFSFSLNFKTNGLVHMSLKGTEHNIIIFLFAASVSFVCFVRVPVAGDGAECVHF